MTDAHIKLSDGVREVSVEINGSDDDPVAKAEAAALRLFGVVAKSSPPGRRTGFSGWAVSSDTERSPEE
ncbi:hypothetical protein ACWD3J_13775 [Streptomyces sp. NPDC002755]